MINVEIGFNKGIEKTEGGFQRFLIMNLEGLSSAASPKLNVTFVIDKSGSMDGAPIANLKEGLKRAITLLEKGDILSIVIFDSEASVLLPSTEIGDDDEKISKIKRLIDNIDAIGGTCIDEGMLLGKKELLKADSQNYVNWMVLFTDGLNEHGEDEECVKIADELRESETSIVTIGLGKSWSPSLLEKLSDMTKGEMFYADKPEDLLEMFKRRIEISKSTIAKNVELVFKLREGVKLSDVNPAFIVKPQIIKLEPIWDGENWNFELGNIFAGRTKTFVAQVFMEPNVKYVMDFKVNYFDMNGNEQEIPWEEGVEMIPLEDTEEVNALLRRLSVYLQGNLVNELMDEGTPERALTLLQTMSLTATKLEDGELSTVIQDNITKVAQGLRLDNADVITTIIQTKTVALDE